MEKTNKQSKRNIIKVVLVGPESTGKSTIAQKLAQHYNTVWVKEYLREFANDKYSTNQKLIYSDNLKIANGQIKLETEAIINADKFIFCDTDILQTIVYSHEYYNKVQPKLEELFIENSADLYILMNLDVPWEADPLRDMPNDRLRIFNVFEEKLKKINKPYFVLKGKNEEKLNNAISAIENNFFQ
jgi:NadR type nicotinamide-nucleotide adenylyltransferase